MAIIMYLYLYYHIVNIVISFKLELYFNLFVFHFIL